ncbi:MAG: hypothetical protein ACXVB4_02145 [Pseudobdellovibrionaceae bacterium]
MIFIFFFFFSNYSLAQSQQRAIWELKQTQALQQRTKDLLIDKDLAKTPVNEKEFIRQFRANELLATGSGNGGDPTALRFSNLAHSALHICRLDQRLEQIDPAKANFFQENLSRIRVRLVDFKLCKNGSSKCSFEDSLAAKTFPDLQLILINQAKYSEMNLEVQISQSLKSFLEVMQISEEKGITSQVYLKNSLVQTENGYQLIQHCSLANTPNE